MAQRTDDTTLDVEDYETTASFHLVVEANGWKIAPPRCIHTSTVLSCLTSYKISRQNV